MRTSSLSEMGLLRKLKASMEEDIWRQEGLTIRKLADILESPEHRLRKVINQGLGYRNFAHFVNEHRIEAACEVLADPVKAVLARAAARDGEERNTFGFVRGLLADQLDTDVSQAAIVEAALGEYQQALIVNN